MNKKQIMLKAKDKGSQKNINGMARFGINVERAFGVSNADLRLMARDIKHEIKNRKEPINWLWSFGGKATTKQ